MRTKEMVSLGSSHRPADCAAVTAAPCGGDDQAPVAFREHRSGPEAERPHPRGAGRGPGGGGAAEGGLHRVPPEIQHVLQLHPLNEDPYLRNLSRAARPLIPAEHFTRRGRRTTTTGRSRRDSPSLPEAESWRTTRRAASGGRYRPPRRDRDGPGPRPGGEDRLFQYPEGRAGSSLWPSSPSSG